MALLRRLAVIALLVSAGTSTLALSASTLRSSGIEWQEGEHYERLASAPPTGGGRVEVIEFFQYGCSHCYSLEPYMVMWGRLKPDYAEVIRVPVTYRPQLRAFARLYYTLEALGRVDNGRADLHHEVYDAVHRVGLPLSDEDEQKAFQTQLEFVQTFGVDADEFTRAYRSPDVEAKVERAGELVRTFRIDGTPMLVINGKYKTHAGMAGGEGRLMLLINDLVLREAPR